MPADRQGPEMGRARGERRGGHRARHPLRIVESTAEAAFVTDQAGRIVCWNDASQRLLGYAAPGVLGRRCYHVLGGRDSFGNRFCNEHCPPRQMARQREPIGPFELYLRRASGDGVSARCSIVVTRAGRKRLLLLHLVQILAGNRDDGCDPAVDGQPAGHGKNGPRQAGADDPPALRAPEARLTAREVQVIRLLGAGGGAAEIAATLSVSPTTVRNHIQHVMQKLRVHSRLHAILAARRDGLI